MLFLHKTWKFQRNWSIIFLNLKNWAIINYVKRSFVINWSKFKLIKKYKYKILQLCLKMLF